MVRNILHHNTACCDLCMIPDADLTDQFCACADQHMVTYYRRTVFPFTDRYLMEDGAILPDHGIV